MKRLLSALVAGLGLCAFASQASATPIEITFTGTLYDTDANGNPIGFPWGYASNTVPASSFYYIAGDSYVAHFRFDTSIGSISSASGTTTLSGPSSIMSGDVIVGGHTFEVPPCAFNPCDAYGQTTFAGYSRSSNSISVLLYEDTSASAGLALQASTSTPWGPNLADPINNASVNSLGIDIVLQPPNSYYTLTAEATVETVSVSAPEPSTWVLTLLGFAAAGLLYRRRSLPPSSEVPESRPGAMLRRPAARSP